MEQVPDPEVPERPRPPRSYPAAYKLGILEEYEQLDKAGKGALLRREGLYTSLISEWRKQRDKGALAAFTAPRGRPPVDPLARENARLQRENARLRDRLERARKVIQVQGDSPRCWTGSRTAAPSGTTASRAADRDGHHRTGPDRGCRRRLPGGGPAPLQLVPPPPPVATTAAPTPAGLAPTAPRADAHRTSAGAGGAAHRAVRGSGAGQRVGDAAGRGDLPGDRRRHATHPPRVKPELLATKPNQCWSWDITKLAGPAKWTWYYQYTILDIYSRDAVGWMVAHREAAALAERLLAETVTAQQVQAGTLTVHADRGASMTSKPVAMLLADLGVTRSHARPHVPDDNPYSESQFKTLKHHPTFPERFGCIQDARAFCQGFFGWYNAEHRHSGIGLLTPADVHYGRADAVTSARAVVLEGAYAAHPERFVGKPPQPPRLPQAVWINKPIDPSEAPQRFLG